MIIASSLSILLVPLHFLSEWLTFRGREESLFRLLSDAVPSAWVQKSSEAKAAG